jgi:diaminopimelate epimerase
VNVEFHKMHGAGNDFVLLDLRQQEFNLDAQAARILAERKFGIGCDQVLGLRVPRDPELLVEFEVWNADGSQAEQCGNGVRCIGLYLSMRKEIPDGPFSIQGPVSRVSLAERADGSFRVNMGRPMFEPAQIPMHATEKADFYELQAEGLLLKVGAVSMGNPHALLEVKDIAEFNVEELGQLISTHPTFPNGCNAGFVEIIDRKNILLRVFERGAAETLACGSGACAAVAILRNSGKLDEEVLVNQVGGELIIEYTGLEEAVMMTGPAVHSFTGMLT